MPERGAVCMRVLLVSDSHGCAAAFAAVLEREPDCKTVFFLGDGLSDLLQMKNAFPDRTFVAVRGNNDWDSRFQSFDDTAYRYLEGNTFLLTHGHRDNVRFSLASLAARTEAVRGNVALFGHTHRPTRQRVPGTNVTAINPGALCSGQYAVLTVTRNGVETEFKTIKTTGEWT